jgi:hypothetical protein
VGATFREEVLAGLTGFTGWDLSGVVDGFIGFNELM